MAKIVEFAVLETPDKIYYVVLNSMPDTIKEKAIRKAEELNKIWLTKKEKS